MSRKSISKCDGCGVEHVDEGDIAGMPRFLGAGRRRGTDSWGNLSFASGPFGASFDLCDACTKRVVDLLELEVPKPETVMGRLGGHTGYLTPEDFMGGRMGPPWSPSGRGFEMPDSMWSSPPPQVAPGVDPRTGAFTCPKCSAKREVFFVTNPICTACGYFDPDPKWGPDPTVPTVR